MEASVDRFSGMLSHAEACKYLGIHYNKLIYAIARGWVRYERTPLGNLFSRDELDRYAEQRGIVKPAPRIADSPSS